jgi:Holliday junction resolvasome RuvABC ATP-dependent DNA helicase subunit
LPSAYAGILSIIQTAHSTELLSGPADAVLKYCKVEIDQEAAIEIAGAVIGTPRIANAFLLRKEFVILEIKGTGDIDLAITIFIEGF